MDLLATIDDVESALGRDLSEPERIKVLPILGKASELFRRHAGQTFTPGTSEVRLKVNGGRVYLPQRPVEEVSSVLDDLGGAVEYTWRQQWLTVDLASHEFVIVSYSHGGEVPDLVRLTVADVARQVLSIAKEAASGATQTSTTSGPYTDSATYAAWAVGGQTRLAPDDVATARSFRVRPPKIIVMSSP